MARNAGRSIGSLPASERPAAVVSYIDHRVTLTADYANNRDLRETFTGLAVALAPTWSPTGTHVLVLVTDDDRVIAFPLTVVKTIAHAEEATDADQK
ncbi:hypothetical protein [Micromonospora sp. WMMD737]|uniref:hypothetical protein n=1 Tax=Micromonospora sp. WMMD737 TaxID=3404113 RepID=UPI003B94FE5F